MYSYAINCPSVIGNSLNPGSDMVCGRTAALEASRSYCSKAFAHEFVVHMRRQVDSALAKEDTN